MRLPAWIAALILLVASGYAVPYLVLPGVERWSGAFLFWIGFGLVVWVVLIGRIAGWNVHAAIPPLESARPGAEATSDRSRRG
jgi:hypothetical protein